MTYFETQQHNSQFNPQQWAAFAQPYGSWGGAPLWQATGGYGLVATETESGRPHTVSNTASSAVSRRPARWI